MFESFKPSTSGDGPVNIFVIAVAPICVLEIEFDDFNFHWMTIHGLRIKWVTDIHIPTAATFGKNCVWTVSIDWLVT